MRGDARAALGPNVAVGQGFLSRNRPVSIGCVIDVGCPTAQVGQSACPGKPPESHVFTPPATLMARVEHVPASPSPGSGARPRDRAGARRYRIPGRSLLVRLGRRPARVPKTSPLRRPRACRDLGSAFSETSALASWSLRTAFSGTSIPELQRRCHPSRHGLCQAIS
jgi:hypothetical protein